MRLVTDTNPIMLAPGNIAVVDVIFQFGIRDGAGDCTLHLHLLGNTFSSSHNSDEDREITGVFDGSSVALEVQLSQNNATNLVITMTSPVQSNNLVILLKPY